MYFHVVQLRIFCLLLLCSLYLCKQSNLSVYKFDFKVKITNSDELYIWCFFLQFFHLGFILNVRILPSRVEFIFYFSQVWLVDLDLTIIRETFDEVVMCICVQSKRATSVYLSFSIAVLKSEETLSWLYVQYWITWLIVKLSFYNQFN